MSLPINPFGTPLPPEISVYKKPDGSQHVNIFGERQANSYNPMTSLGGSALLYKLDTAVNGANPGPHHIVTADTNDTALFSGSFSEIPTSSLSLMGGNDLATFSATHAQNAFIDMGSGDDRLSINFNEADGNNNMTFIGGEGKDTLDLGVFDIDGAVGDFSFAQDGSIIYTNGTNTYTFKGFENITYIPKDNTPTIPTFPPQPGPAPVTMSFKSFIKMVNNH